MMMHRRNAGRKLRGGVGVLSSWSVNDRKQSVKKGGIKKNRAVNQLFTARSVIQLGLEPRALSLKVKCSTD